MKVLAYSGEDSVLNMWADAEICRDNPPLVNEYDAVYIENVLQQMLRREMEQVVRIFHNALKDGGEIVVTVPSLEWACREIATSDEPSKLAYIAIYGTDEEPHISGFTLLWLRKLMERGGFETDACYSLDFIVETEAGKLRGRNNIYKGRKTVIELGDPSDAIE